MRRSPALTPSPSTKRKWRRGFHAVTAAMRFVKAARAAKYPHDQGPDSLVVDSTPEGRARAAEDAKTAEVVAEATGTLVLSSPGRASPPVETSSRAADGTPSPAIGGPKRALQTTAANGHSHHFGARLAAGVAPAAAATPGHRRAKSTLDARSPVLGGGAVGDDDAGDSQEWVRYPHSSGKHYFYNVRTGASQWHKPAGFTQHAHGASTSSSHNDVPESHSVGTGSQDRGERPSSPTSVRTTASNAGGRQHHPLANVSRLNNSASGPLPGAEHATRRVHNAFRPQRRLSPVKKAGMAFTFAAANKSKGGGHKRAPRGSRASRGPGSVGPGRGDRGGGMISSRSTASMALSVASSNNNSPTARANATQSDAPLAAVGTGARPVTVATGGGFTLGAVEGAKPGLRSALSFLKANGGASPVNLSGSLNQGGGTGPSLSPGWGAAEGFTVGTPQNGAAAGGAASKVRGQPRCLCVCLGPGGGGLLWSHIALHSNLLHGSMCDNVQAFALSPPLPGVDTQRDVSQFWVERFDPASGYAYYENTASGETTWERPAALDAGVS